MAGPLPDEESSGRRSPPTIPARASRDPNPSWEVRKFFLDFRFKQVNIGLVCTPEVPLHIRCRFAGELVEADGKPATTLLNEHPGINQRSELAWILPLKPGQEQTLHYRYHYWTRY